MFLYPIWDDSSALRMMVVSQLKLWRPRAGHLEEKTSEEQEEEEALDEAKHITWCSSHYWCSSRYWCSLELAYSHSVRASQSCRGRFISVLVLILHIPYRKCIPSSTHAPSMEKVKKLFIKEQHTTVNLYSYACCHLQGAREVRKLLATDKRFHPINGVGIKLLKAGKSSALLNPNPRNPLIGVFLTVKCWF